MSNVVNKLLAQVDAFQSNPTLIQRAVLQTLEEVSNGTLTVVDPTNPFVFALESSAVLTAGFMIKNEASTRKQYPYSAQLDEDLYLHMSDKDYANRFATPSTTKFCLMLPEEEVLEKMVTDPATGIRKLVIPRNTFFSIAGTKFSLQYPIEIRQLAHGGIQVVYDTDKVSPLQDLSTNIIEWEIRQSSEGTWIWFEVDVMQFSIISQTGSLNSATDFKVDIGLEEQYYYTRVYVETSDGQWLEIRTTHTDQIYDAMTPTAVLKVVNNVVSVSIPQIYTSSGLLNRSIRIDVYQTKGKLDMLLSDYPFSAFGATWQTYDVNDDTVFTAPLKTFKAVIPYSNRAVTGGTNPMTFEELRMQVIKNAIGSPSLPITNVQLESTLNLAGYEVVMNIDNITNRVFLATKNMPTPIDEKLITAAASSIETISLTAQEAILLDSVVDNGTSITITPDTLYRNVNGITSMVPSNEVAALLQLPVDKRASVITGASYLYTPFHYVLDMTNNAFDVRPYYLDSPQVETKLFVSENDSTLLQVGTKTYGIVRNAKGFFLQVETQSSAGFKALADDETHVQLAFIPPGEKDRAYLTGELVGKSAEGERIYNFDLSTTFNINSDDNIEFTKFLMYTVEERITVTPLLTTFDVIYSTSAVMDTQWITGSVDKLLGRFLLPSRIAGITHEKLRIRFGYALNNLWARARSVISSVPYKTWEVDVPRFYEEDVYVRDALGSAITIGADGTPHYTILHKRGDPVLDKDGNPVYQYRAGDVKLDNDNNPIPTSERGMLRQIDLMLIEGAYWFATDASAIGYRATLTKTIVDWLTEDLAGMTDQLLEQTRLYFYPKTTLGMINVMFADGIITSIPAGQAFKVNLRVPANVYGNEELKARLTKTTVKIISEMLTTATVSMSAIISALRASYGQDVIDVQITGLGGDANLHTLTVMDDANRCSIRKRLVALPDDSLIVEEDVTVNYTSFVSKLQ